MIVQIAFFYLLNHSCMCVYHILSILNMYLFLPFLLKYKRTILLRFFKKPALGFINPLNCVFVFYFSKFYSYIHYFLCPTFTGFILFFFLS